MGQLTIWDRADQYGNLAVADIAESYGVDVRTVRKWIDAGLLPARQLPHGGRFVVRVDELKRFDASLRHAPEGV